MSQSKKVRVAVLYGGRSGEHEVSLQSAASVIKNLDSEQYDVIPIGIDKEGRWHLNDMSLIEDQIGKELPVFKDNPEVLLPPHPASGEIELVPVGKATEVSQSLAFDVAFPVVHGPLCEDGTIQGLLEIANVPYVGAGVLGSAVGMDKDVAKRLVGLNGIKVAPYIVLRSSDWNQEKKKVQKYVSEKLDYPVFVKPANMGSSVGIHRVVEGKGLEAAIEDAFQYDSKILVETGIDCREIELSVLENLNEGEPPLVSVAGEITPKGHEFYSYDSKYLDENGAELLIPAKIDDAQMESVQKMARDIFLCLECEGMARVDLMLDKKSGEFYFNEVNTIPGFTKISMYPKMWEASGLKYQDLLSYLIELARARHARKNALKRDWD